MGRVVPESNPAEQTNVTKTLIGTQELTDLALMPDGPGIGLIHVVLPPAVSLSTHVPRSLSGRCWPTQRKPT